MDFLKLTHARGRYLDLGTELISPADASISRAPKARKPKAPKGLTAI